MFSIAEPGHAFSGEEILVRVSRAETSVLLFGVGDVWAFFVKYSEVGMFPQLIRVLRDLGVRI